MIKIISHRNNLTGPNPQYENNCAQVSYVLNQGFMVEVDVWKLPDEDNCFRLGHDKPILWQSVNTSFLENPNLLVHCKNQEAWEVLKDNPLVNCFQQDSENWVKTSQGDIIVHGDISPGIFQYNFEYKESDIIGDYRNIIYAYFVNKEFIKDMETSLILSNYYILTDYPISYKEGLYV